jgi:hypothetical protein
LSGYWASSYLAATVRDNLTLQPRSVRLPANRMWMRAESDLRRA